MLEAKIEALEKDLKDCHQCSNLTTTKENPQDHIKNKHKSDNLLKISPVRAVLKHFLHLSYKHITMKRM